jgi:hypothetical protein
MTHFELEPYFSPESEDKEEILSIEGTLYRFTPNNTVIKYFDVGNGEYDNLVHIHGMREDKQPAIVMFLSQLNKNDSHLIERLLEKNFPVKFDSQPDELTVEAFCEWAVRDSNEDIPSDIDED